MSKPFTVDMLREEPTPPTGNLAPSVWTHEPKSRKQAMEDLRNAVATLEALQKMAHIPLIAEASYVLHEEIARCIHVLGAMKD